MENRLTGKQNLTKISSPEEMHDYMRVTNPRLWLLLGTIVVALIVLIVLAATTTLENTMHIPVNVETVGRESENPADWVTLVTCDLPSSMQGHVAVGMKLRLGKNEGAVSWITSSGADTLSVVFEMDQAFLPLPDGTYDADLVLETTTPMSFLWN